MSDCIKGKQYLSKSFINPNGACVACPPNWKSCHNEPIDDQKRCVDSCRVKPKVTTTKALRRASTAAQPFAATSTFRPTRSFATTIKSSSMYYSPGIRPVEARAEQEVSVKTHGMKIEHVIAVSGGSGLLLVLFMVVLVILLVRKYRRRPVRDRGESSRNAEEGVALQTLQQSDKEEHLQRNGSEELLPQNDNDKCLRPNGTDGHLISNDAEQQATLPNSVQLPVQATSSEISIHGIQDTSEELMKSRLLVSEFEY